MYKLKQWILLLLLVPVFVYSQTVLDTNHYLVISYNYPPDSLFIDGKPVQNVTQNMRYRVPESGTYHVKAILHGAKPIEKDVAFVNTRFATVDLKFTADENASFGENGVQNPSFVTYSFLNDSDMMTMKFAKNWGLANIFGVGTALVFGLKQDDYAGRTQFPVFVGGLALQLFSVAKLYYNFYEHGKIQHPGYTTGSGIGLFAAYSVFDFNNMQISEYKVIRLTRIVGSTQFRHRRTDIRGVAPDFGTFSLGFEKHLSDDLSITAMFAYKPITAKLSVTDTVKYGSNEVLNLAETEIDYDFVFTSISMNYRFLRILNQEWLLNIGGFWGSSLSMDLDYRIKILRTVDIFEDVSAHFNYSLGGALLGFQLLTPITKKFNILFGYSKIGIVKSEINGVEKSSLNTVWQGGLRYEFR
ncbi:MAG: hypothetical protein KDH95_03740 [Calditrichaeota bacterium]|nr:hypothetical protein [Calditrichota bacterium]MCB0267262.1 hypothetical protein [Calditrichota bacterium]